MTPRRQAMGLVVSAAMIAILGTLPLSSPPSLGWAAVDRWYLELGPAAAAMAVLRFTAQLGCGWLVLASGLQLVTARAARPRLHAIADRVTPRFLRSVTCGAASLSLSAALLAPAAPLAAAGPPPGTAVMVPLDPTTTTTAPTTAASRAPAPPTTVATSPASPPPRARAPRPASPGSARHDEVVVHPGDSFWTVAEEEAGDRGVTSYWRALIEANRDRLVDPANPDLLYPGQVLRLPPT